jgi:hypothetical protein
MREFRAKDADRDRCVEVIEAAYVDGQLGDADRELRISRALTAETLDELQTLTRDLQLPPGHVPQAAPTRSPTRSPAGVRRLGGGLAAVVLVLVLPAAGIISLVMFAVGGSVSETAGPSGGPVVVSEEAVPVEEAAARTFEMTPADVRAFLRGYEKQFGTLDAFSAVFYPTRVSLEVPVRGARPRAERWSYDGTWRQDSEASAVTGPDRVVDLGAIGISRLFANVATAKKVLRVQRGELTHVGVRNWDDLATVNIYIGNRFNESGYLMTTMSGVEIRRFPFAP